MARPRGSRDTRQQILTTATGAFAAGGLHGTRLADIASSVGITRPSLLHHFPTKDELYDEVIQGAFVRLGRALSNPLELEGTFVERFEAMVEAFVGFVTAEPSTCMLLIREVVDTNNMSQQILEGAGGLLDAVDAFVRDEGAGVVRPGIDTRAALMQLATSAILRAASGGLRDPLFGPRDHTLAHARVLFFREEYHA